MYIPGSKDSIVYSSGVLSLETISAPPAGEGDKRECMPELEIIRHQRLLLPDEEQQKNRSLSGMHSRRTKIAPTRRFIQFDRWDARDASVYQPLIPIGSMP